MSKNDSAGDKDAVTPDATSDAGQAKGRDRNSVRKAGDRQNSAVRRVAQAADTGDKRDRSLTNRLGFPAIVGLVTILGLALVIYAWATRDPKLRPVQGEDHWHAVYGIYDCTLSGGDGGYLPAFLSQVDLEGIHSHQDGIMHIHPWFDSSDGPDARLEVFFESMQVVLDDDQIVLDNGRVLAEGAATSTCNGEPAIVQVHKWQFWFEAQAGNAPQIFTENLDQVQFLNDREVYIIAFAPEGADVPIPPAERFEQLERVAPIVQSSGPVNAETQTFNVPAPTDDEDGGG